MIFSNRRLTATEAIEQTIEIAPPAEVKSEEEYHRWCLAEIHRAAVELAQHHIDALVKIEASKPRRPIFLPLDQLPADLLGKVRGEKP